MSKIYTLFTFLALFISILIGKAQPANNNCSGAILLTAQGQTCGTATTGNNNNATLSMNAINCNGNGNVTDADDDVWYKFVATSNAHTITLNGTAPYYALPTIDIRSGANCASTGSIACGSQNCGPGFNYSAIASYGSFTVGTTYYIRVYDSGDHVGGSFGSYTTFNICVTTNPANDNCSGATPLTVFGAACGSPTTGNVSSTTESLPGIYCNGGNTYGYANDDVWYSFVATASAHNITVAGSSGFDAMVDLRDGTCISGTNNINCEDQTLAGGTEVMQATGLTPGTTYYVRVFDKGQYRPTTPTFTICVTTPGATGTAPVANFSASSTNITAGGSTNFTDLSTNTPTSWSWNFTGGTPATSTAQNPTGITYATPGCYQVTLTATNGFGSDPEVKTCYINVTTGGGSYCSISSTTGTTDGDFIDGVTLGTINNVNTGSVTGAYYNNYTAMSTNLVKTSTYTVNIKSGTWMATYPDYYSAWIDYNQDNDFADAGEQLGEFLSTAPSTTQGITFTVPASSLTGSTRMRVRGVWATAAGLDPCAAYNYGETEDYSVNITTGGVAPVANFSASSTAINTGGSVNFTDLSTNAPTSWSWSFTGGTPSTSTAQNPSGISYAAAGCYQVTLTATNASGSDPEVRTCYINVTTATGSYCAITTSTYGTTEGDFIDGVTLGSINNINSGSTTGTFYYNYTSMSTNLVKSSTYTISIKSGTWLATYPDYYAVWIDYNSDYDFSDSGENLGEFLSTAPSTTQNIVFTVPASANTGSTRMRVKGVWANTTGIDPCLLYNYGETEDYSVNITNAVGIAKDAASSLSFEVYPNPTEGEFTLEINTAKSNPVSYTVINAVGQEITRNEIKVKVGSHYEKIDLGNYPDGIYFMQIKTENGIVVKKIIKQ